MPPSQSDSRAREQRVFDLAARYKRERDEAREQLAAMTAAREVVAGPPPPRCDEPRGPRAKTRCELPPGHRDAHLGRSPTGRWFTWRAASGEAHCKAAATRAGENHIGVLTWLRDNHSEVYEEAIEAHGWG